jgi:hypothetical protein
MTTIKEIDHASEIITNAVQKIFEVKNIRREN